MCPPVVAKIMVWELFVSSLVSTVVYFTNDKVEIDT